MLCIRLKGQLMLLGGTNMWFLTILLGILILDSTTSRIGDLAGLAVIAYGVYKLYIREKKTWNGGE